MTELKPCPFCGETINLELDSLGETEWFIECNRCDLSQHAMHRTKDSAIKAWNTRAKIEELPND